MIAVSRWGGRVFAWRGLWLAILLYILSGVLNVGGELRHHDHRLPQATTFEVRPNATGADLVDVQHPTKLAADLHFFDCAPAGSRALAGARGWPELQTHNNDAEGLDRLVAYANEEGGARTRKLSMCDDGDDSYDALQYAAFAAFIAALVAWSVRDGRFAVAVRASHFVPITIQLALYAYWAVYWSGVRAHVTSLVLQLALAFALDAALSFARFRSWRIGLSAIPIVLSANLFAWFDPTASVVVVATAMATKTLVRRGGHHIFNPSAAGLVAGALYLAFVPHASWTGLFHAENAAPNMPELVLLLSLFPLLRFRLALIPLGAALALVLRPSILTTAPNLNYPGMLIAITLFASDPATTPRTPGGRLLFGVLVGFGIAVASRALSAHGHPDDFSKVIPVPLANLLAPKLDQIANALPRFARRILDARWTPVHAALWVGLVVITLSSGKAQTFEAGLHWTYQTPTVVRDADDVPRCPRNPAFCRPFAFVSEINAWRRLH